MGHGSGAFYLGTTDDEKSYQPYNGGKISRKEWDVLYEERGRRNVFF